MRRPRARSAPCCSTRWNGRWPLAGWPARWRRWSPVPGSTRPIPHFANPSKPIGRYLPEAEARLMIGHGQVWQDRGAQGLAAGGRLARAGGDPRRARRCGPAGRRFRGGRRRRRRHSGRACDRWRGARGVEAVIDKDLSAALLGRAVGADMLVHRHRRRPTSRSALGRPARTPLGAVSVARLRGYAARGAVRRRLDGPQGRGGLPVRGSAAASAPSSRHWTASPRPSAGVRPVTVVTANQHDRER